MAITLGEYRAGVDYFRLPFLGGAPGEIDVKFIAQNDNFKDVTKRVT